MNEPTSLAARRWKTDQQTESFTPRDALVEALRQLDAGEIKADHILICHAWKEARGESVGWFQSGDLTPLGQLGLLTRVSHVMTMGG